MTLREHLQNLSGNPLLVLSPHGSVTRDDALAYGLGAAQGLVGTRIGLRIADPGAAFPLLALLDGTAEVIMLVSPSVAPGQVARLAAEAELDALLSDAPFALPDDCSVPVFHGFKALAAQVTPRSKPEETLWVLLTSGTTGEPKLVGHTLESLTRTTRIDPVRGASARWGLLYDYTRFAGLQVLLQSTLSGSTLIAPPVDHPLEERIKTFVSEGCTHLSGTPTLWRKIAMTTGCEELNLAQITLGGEIADDRILSSLAALYPGARVVHIFASTEAGVGFSVTDGKAGFPAVFLDTPPASGVGIRVDDGRLYVRNQLVSPRYLGTEGSFADNDGWVDTGDAVEIRGDRVLFKGRANGVINVGGDKVHPEEVEQVLLSHPLVSAARVYSRSNPITGALVAADIVLADAGADAQAARETLRLYVQGELGRTKTPATIKIVGELNLSAAGKLQRG